MARARVRVPLDETWLARLLEQQHDSSAAPAPLPHSPPVDADDAEAPKPGPLTDWGDAPEVSTFYGREDELAVLSDWLLEQHCRVVSVLGMGGIHRQRQGQRNRLVSFRQNYLGLERIQTDKLILVGINPSPHEIVVTAHHPIL